MVVDETYRLYSTRIAASAAGSGLSWILVRSVDSTNALARRLIERWPKATEDLPETVLLAWEQSRGRGRSGRPWISKKGQGIWATLIVSATRFRELGLLPLGAGVALAGCLNHHLGGRVGLKWPNDLYVGGAKLGGVLIEAITRGERTTAILGFGINHGLRPPELRGRKTTSVKLESDIAPSMAELALELVTSVHEVIKQPPAADRLLETARELSTLRAGDRVSLATREGDVSGVFHDIDGRGLMVLETGDGLRRIAAAEIVHS